MKEKVGSKKVEVSDPDFHRKPPARQRSVDDALRGADRSREELPKIVQVRASDWDKVILADEIMRLRNSGGAQ